MIEGLDFRRIVVQLPYNTRDIGAVRAAARMAELLQLDLLGTFIEDARLIEAANLPDIRELRPTGGWQPISAAQIRQEFIQAATASRHTFESITNARAGQTAFAFIRGSPANVIGSLAQKEDILAIIEPASVLERGTHQFDRTLSTALGTKAAVMVLPSRVIRTTGPIVAVASSQADPCIRLARAIASAAKERMIVARPSVLRNHFTVAETMQPEGFIAIGGTDVKRNVQFERPAWQSDCQEHLIVMTRGTFEDALPSAIASRRRVPVLVTEPD